MGSGPSLPLHEIFTEICEEVNPENMDGFNIYVHRKLQENNIRLSKGDMENLYAGIVKHIVEECTGHIPLDVYEWIVRGSHFLAAKYIIDEHREDFEIFITCVAAGKFSFLRKLMKYRGVLPQHALDEILQIAVLESDLPIINHMIFWGANPESDNYRAFDESAMSKDIFQYLWNHRPKINQYGYIVPRDVPQEKLDHWLAINLEDDNSVSNPMIHLLVTLGANPNVKNSAALQAAIKAGNIKELKFLLEHGEMYRGLTSI